MARYGWKCSLDCHSRRCLKFPKVNWFGKIQDEPKQPAQQVEIPFGQIALKQTPDGEYQWMTQDFEFQSLDHPKVTLDLKVGFSSTGWRFNLKELPLAPFRPLISLLSIDSDVKNAIQEINPEGTLTDLRLPNQHKVRLSFPFQVSK